MSKRKHERRMFDFSDFFNLGFKEERLFEQEPLEDKSSGYSISVTYDKKGKPVVRSKPMVTWTLQNFVKTLKDNIQERRLKGWKNTL